MQNSSTINFIHPPSSLSSVPISVFNSNVPFALSDRSVVDSVHDTLHAGEFLRPAVVACIGSTSVIRNDPVTLLSGDRFDAPSVPVAKVTKCLDVWSAKLLGDENETFILEGIKDGFNIVDSSERPPGFDRKNYRSTTHENKSKVEKRILEEIAKGNYIRSKLRPTYVSSLGAVPKDLDDVRVIHDLSRPNGGINAFASDTSVVYTSVDKITRLITENSYLAKVDLKSAYRSIPINESCYGLTGIQ